MKSETYNTGTPLGNYCAFHSALALLNHDKSAIMHIEFGSVFAESKNKLIVVDDENNIMHAYLIPKSRLDHYGNKQAYFDIPGNSLGEFEM